MQLTHQCPNWGTKYALSAQFSYFCGKGWECWKQFASPLEMAMMCFLPHKYGSNSRPPFRHSLECIGHELLLVIKAQACVNFPASALISHNGLFQNNFTIPKYSIITLIISVVIKKSAETQHLFELYHTFSLSLQAAWNSTIFIFVVPSSS